MECPNYFLISLDIMIAIDGEFIQVKKYGSSR